MTGADGVSQMCSLPVSFCSLSGDSAGRLSVSTTFREFEMMFQVSTLQPNNSQQVLVLLEYCRSTCTVVAETC